MLVRLPVCISSDLSLPLPIYSPHNFAPVPPVPPVPPPTPAVSMSPAPACAMDSAATMLWPPGNALFLNKYSLSVTHKKLGIIQAGHDLGIMIPHVQMAPAPNNFFTPLQTLFSSRKVMFNSSSVKANGVFVGFAGLIGMMPSPMLVCGEPISFPMGEVPTRWMNNVWAGMSPTDLAIGAMNIAARVAVEKVAIPKTRLGPLKKLVKEARSGRAENIYKKMFPVLSRAEAWKSIKKQGIGMAAGVVSAIARGEGGSSVSLGSSFANVSLSVERNAKQEWSATVKTQVPMLSESGAVKQGTGVVMTGSANWGTGGGSVATESTKSTTTTHDGIEGTSSKVEKAR